MKKFYLHFHSKLLRPSRLKRMKMFMDTFNITETTKILDVGGTPFNWALLNCPAQITLLNLQNPSLYPNLPTKITYKQGSGTNIQFEDNFFDIVFSNSVIEHLFNFENQQKFAEEVSRVGTQLWIQTPSYSFFFEPHFLTPFFHYLPKTTQRKIAQNFTTWGLIMRPQKEYAENMANEICLLKHDELQNLFPDCLVHKEFFLGMEKALIAIRKDKK